MYVRVWKRALDLVLALFAFPFWLGILAILGPMIYLEDRGPVFYNSYRLGRNGRVFKMYKFRSMKVGAPDIRNEDGSTYSGEDDGRLTRIGKAIRKASLDETPQLINIIKGDMSVIGPRPDLPEDIECYRGDQKTRLRLKPGVTGFSQANFRNTIPANEKYDNDVYYVRNVSFRMDCVLFFKTAKIVIGREKVFSLHAKDYN
jgi:lipopolysaccharide/colanic/teichoic acid biosynthesis glycosyltransferase